MSTLPHRSVSSIKKPAGISTTLSTLSSSDIGVGGSGGGGGGGGGAPASPSSPHTPLRSGTSGILPSSYSSPSALRAEEDVIVVDVGTRGLRVGFAGDVVPRGSVLFAPENHRRVGDFRAWAGGANGDGAAAGAGQRGDGYGGEEWGRDHELLQPDVRGLDLGLMDDKLERALREAFAKYLLIDTRPRRIVLVLPSALPIPLLSALLDGLFIRFQPPSVSLLSGPVMATVAAGVRAALVVDLGWSETVVTAIYEYREILSRRSVRGGRMLVEQTHNLLTRHMASAARQGEGDEPGDDEGTEKAGGGDKRDPELAREHLISFPECDDITCRMVWCRPMKKGRHGGDGRDGAIRGESGLSTVQEMGEPSSGDPFEAPTRTTTRIPIASSQPPTNVTLPFDELAEPTERAFFAPQYRLSSFDDEELPLHVLVYRALLQLPLDVRAICMARIIFVGGCASVLGLRGRIFDEVEHLVQTRGWDPVYGKAVEQLRTNPLLRRRGNAWFGGDVADTAEGAPVVSRPPDHQQQQQESQLQHDDGVWHDAANRVPEVDPIDEQLQLKKVKELVQSYPAGGGGLLSTSNIGGGGSLASSSSAISSSSAAAASRLAAAAALTTSESSRRGDNNNHNNIGSSSRDAAATMAAADLAPAHGRMRALDSIGPWAGASLAAQLRVPAVATVDRDAWLAHGAAGAGRPQDIDTRTCQRHSVGPSGLMRGAGTGGAGGGGGADASGAGGSAGASWTLGIWGAG